MGLQNAAKGTPSHVPALRRLQSARAWVALNTCSRRKRILLQV